MTERPILFSGPMVRAILEGRKTVTRRVIKLPDPDRARLLFFDSIHGRAQFGDSIPDDPVPITINCPQGAEGDRLYVREHWRTGSALDGDSPAEIRRKALDAGYPKVWGPVKYEADDRVIGADCLDDFGGSWGRHRQGMHMLREFSRTDLEIVSVRVERLQDITEADAVAEGVDCQGVAFSPVSGKQFETTAPARIVFASLWDTINGPREDGAFSWLRNPWVWRVEFPRVCT